MSCGPRYPMRGVVALRGRWRSMRSLAWLRYVLDLASAPPPPPPQHAYAAPIVMIRLGGYNHCEGLAPHCMTPSPWFSSMLGVAQTKFNRCFHSIVVAKASRGAGSGLAEAYLCDGCLCLFRVVVGLGQLPFGPQADPETWTFGFASPMLANSCSHG